MKREYPYLMSSLPELTADFDTKKIDFFALKKEVEDNIHKNDIEYVRQLFYPHDNQNILNIIADKHESFDKKGSFTEEIIMRSLKKISDDDDDIIIDMPKYLDTFFEIHKIKVGEEEKTEYHEMYNRDKENLLTRLFYEQMSKSGNIFIRKWFNFDKDLRNIQTAIISRQLKINAENYFVGEDAETLSKSNASDFGLKDKIEWINKILQIAEIPNALERERKIDMFRWEKINEISIYNYFDIDAILAFLAKANIVDRWITLDPKTGKEMFKKMLNELINTCDTEKVFKKIS